MALFEARKREAAQRTTHKAQTLPSCFCSLSIQEPFLMMAADGYFIYTGREPRRVMPGGQVTAVTRVRIDKSVTVIPARAFQFHHVVEVVFDVGVETIEEEAVSCCRFLRRLIMPGVKVIETRAFYYCDALTDVECGELEIIGVSAFRRCKSLGSINLPSAKIVEGYAFDNCEALTDVKFGSSLERIEEGAFAHCPLERISIPLKDGMITDDNIFKGCENLEHVDLVGGIHETVAALQVEGWRNDINEEIDSINQILPTARAGSPSSYNTIIQISHGDPDGDVGEKAIVIRSWIRSVLRKLIGYKAQHHRLLDEAATTLELAALPKDIVIENVLPFLELPSYTFEVES
eukprot:scaffold17842_cov160-Skeletonema_dohrnii-CCMP3373.AAC.2